ncbi:MAG: hypothetical protein P4K86_05910 [Terracidiphilus sp.]|nr:hypothetical protein [Terracidiphilus sp.]
MHNNISNTSAVQQRSIMKSKSGSEMSVVLPRGKTIRRACALVNRVWLLTFPALVSLVGCGNGSVWEKPANIPFAIGPHVRSIDTNCYGCNSINTQGAPVELFSTTLPKAGASRIRWSVSGGDATSGAGQISLTGEYTPPSYLTADTVQVNVTASLDSDSSIVATAVLTVTPGFLQPLSPENVALGANQSANITGFLTEVGGSTEIDFAIASSVNGADRGQGTLSAATCKRSSQAFTSCTVTYTAPSSITASIPDYVVASVGNSSAKTAVEVLLNTAGVLSNPAPHQGQLITPLQLGSSGGNNDDYDSLNQRVVDCCSGTLGALLRGSNNMQYLLSNNHVLARSDHANAGDMIIQPGLIDNNCTPNGSSGGTTPVGIMTGWLPLKSSSTNVDAAIAQVVPGMVDRTGKILEMGAKLSDGTLAAAPPGVSSSNGKGESGQLQLKVAKSGRTTGLTCAKITALDLDVNVNYYLDCAESQPYLSKTYINQIEISGAGFMDAGDSGSLLLDVSNAEPVGLLFAGGTDSLGVSHAIANPVADVLSELGAQTSGVSSFTFVGGEDHEVNCLDYGDGTITAVQANALSDTEMERAQQAMALARTLVNPDSGILGVAIGKSNDHPGEAAIIIYVADNMSVSVPLTVGGVRTVVIPSSAHDVMTGSAPLSNSSARSPALSLAALSSAIAIKQKMSSKLMQQNAAIFGVGVGQSLDNPKEPALVIYTDRKKLPTELPQTVGGIRTQYIAMDRLHVTRAYSTSVQSRPRCMAHGISNTSSSTHEL